MIWFRVYYLPSSCWSVIPIQKRFVVSLLKALQAAVKTWKLMFSSFGSNNLPPLSMHFSDAALKESFWLSGTKHFPSTIWHFPEKFDLVNEWMLLAKLGMTTTRAGNTVIGIGGIQKLHWPFFALFWPPTYLWLTCSLIALSSNVDICKTTYPPRLVNLVLECPLIKMTGFLMFVHNLFIQTIGPVLYYV